MLDIKTAEEMVTAEVEAQVARRAARETRVVQAIYRTFVASGGPAPLEAVMAAMPDIPRTTLTDALAALDADDLIQIVDGRVEVAYPFAARPTPFVVRLAGGPERYACCAIDALGIAPMIGRPIDIASRCHHSGAPLALAVTPGGPGRGADQVMVWVGRRCEGERRAATGL